MKNIFSTRCSILCSKGRKGMANSKQEKSNKKELLRAKKKKKKATYGTFCHKGGVICIHEVIDISPRNLDSSLCFIQPGILNDLLCIEVKKAG